MSKAVRLVLRIFGRIPVLPQSLFLNVKRITCEKGDIEAGIGVSTRIFLRYARQFKFQKDRCAAALIWRYLDKNYIHVEMELQEHSLIVLNKYPLRSKTWRQTLPLDSNTVIELVLDVARAIQYLHSMGVVYGFDFDFGHLYLDLNLRPRIRFACEFLHIIMGFERKRSLYEDNVFSFGCFFYAVRLPALSFSH
ncbi:hypothetical protein JOM56_014488 [Amanita muscaria]